MQPSEIEVDTRVEMYVAKLSISRRCKFVQTIAEFNNDNSIIRAKDIQNEERRKHDREAEEAKTRAQLAGDEARRLAMANYAEEKNDTDEAVERKRKKAMLHKEKEIFAHAKFVSLQEYEKREREINLDMMLSYVSSISSHVGVGTKGKYVTSDVDDETEMMEELKMPADE